VIQGTDLWRNPDVSIAGMGANPGSIHVLPDMEGISAEFDIEKLQSLVGTDKTAALAVMTESGDDSRELSIDDVVKDAATGMCSGKPKPSPSVLQPSEISRCATGADLLLALSGELLSQTDGSESDKKVAACHALIDGKPADATCAGLDESSRNAGKDKTKQQCALMRITYHGLTSKLLDGRNSLPITLQCGARVQSETLALVGGKCDVKEGSGGDVPKPKGEPKVDSITNVETKGATIKACSNSATLVAAGSNLQTLESALLLATSSESVKLSKDGTQATIVFKHLPVVPEKTTPGADKLPLELRFTSAKKQTIDMGWQKCDG
jgi:hypothetical protein